MSPDSIKGQNKGTRHRDRQQQTEPGGDKNAFISLVAHLPLLKNQFY